MLLLVLGLWACGVTLSLDSSQIGCMVAGVITSSCGRKMSFYAVRLSFRMRIDE